jgi:uncharacterized membrane protein
MSEFIALIFDDAHKAGEARIALSRLESDGLIHVSATAVIIRKLDGRTRLMPDTNVVELRGKAGRFAGLLRSALAGALPIGFAGAVTGRLFGTLRNSGVSRDFIKQVAMKLEPGTSALLVRLRSDPAHPANIDEQLRGLVPKGLGSSLAVKRNETGRTAGANEATWPELV